MTENGVVIAGPVAVRVPGGAAVGAGGGVAIALGTRAAAFGFTVRGGVVS
jgi:hypothetical protein